MTTFAIDVTYKMPANAAHEANIEKCILCFGGTLEFRDESKPNEASAAICLTFEFKERDLAQQAADVLRKYGEYVDGPYDYG